MRDRLLQVAAHPRRHPVRPGVVGTEAGREPLEALEGLVREMLRPMLREWIDANLPNMVEDMVSREIAKIMNQQP